MQLCLSRFHCEGTRNYSQHILNHSEAPNAPFEASIRTVWSLQTSQDYWTEDRFAIYCTGGLSLAIISILETGQRNDFHSVRTSIGHLAACDHNHQIGFAQWHLFLIILVFCGILLWLFVVFYFGFLWYFTLVFCGI